MFGKLISSAFLFVFNVIIFIVIDTAFQYFTGDAIVPSGYELLYLIAAAVTVYYQHKSNEEKKAKLAKG